MGRIVSLALLAALSGVAAAGAQADSLFARLGGESGVAAIANDTIAAASANPALQAGLDRDPKGLREQLAARICALSGGGCKVQGSLGLGDREFAEFVEVLRVTLRSHEVPLAARNELLESIAALRSDRGGR